MSDMADNRTTELRLIAELRLMARLVREYDYAEIRQMLRKAADTIESLRDKLQDENDAMNKASGNWARVDAELRRYDGTRYAELFGTPEKAARTLQAIPCGSLPCSKCPMFKPCCCVGVKEDEETFYDVLLEWLSGDDNE